MIRRGAAMMIVLAASVVLLSAAAIVARVQATAVIRDRVSGSFAVALELSNASDAVILEWLHAESREVVLAPDAPAPSMTVLSDTLRFGEQQITIEVTAWDQSGMMPGSDLESLPNLQRLLEGFPDGRDGIDTAHPGLDMLPSNSGVFPSRDRVDAFGGLVATHNPHPSEANRRGSGVPSLNINTAPEPVLRAALQDLEIVNVEPILTKRRLGERAIFDGTGTRGVASVRLVSSSAAWSFRTDITIDGPGHTAVSVWSVYCLRGGTWVREQRYVIAD